MILANQNHTKDTNKRARLHPLPSFAAILFPLSLLTLPCSLAASRDMPPQVDSFEAVRAEGGGQGSFARAEESGVGFGIFWKRLYCLLLGHTRNAGTHRRDGESKYGNGGVLRGRCTATELALAGSARLSKRRQSVDWTDSVIGYQAREVVFSPLAPNHLWTQSSLRSTLLHILGRPIHTSLLNNR